MSAPLTKRRLREALDVEHDSEIAAFFGISPSAVSQWPVDDAIPELRQLQAERKRPDLFGSAGTEAPENPGRHRVSAAPAGDAAAAAAKAVPVSDVDKAA